MNVIVLLTSTRYAQHYTGIGIFDQLCMHIRVTLMIFTLPQTIRLILVGHGEVIQCMMAMLHEQ